MQIRSTDHSFIKDVAVFDHQPVIAGINIELASNNTFEDLAVYSIEGDAILVETADHNKFANLLIYNNDKSGILFAQGEGNSITNATIYKNVKDGYKTSPTNITNQTWINFIIALNGEEGIDDRCLCTSHTFNMLWMNTRGFEPSDTCGPDPTEIMMASLFVNPNGPDGMLGSVHGADDDFRYQQTAAGDLQNSPAVKAGSASAAHLGLDDKTTRSDNVPDMGRVDIGYHYRIAGVAQMLPVPPEDLDTEIKALCTRLHTFVNNINGWIGEGLLDSESGRSWIETTHRLQDKLACILE